MTIYDENFVYLWLKDVGMHNRALDVSQILVVLESLSGNTSN